VKRRAIFQLILLVGAGLASVACHPSDAGEMAEERARKEAQLEPRSVRLVTPEIREERPAIELVAEVRAFDEVTVAGQVAGAVEEVLVEVGDLVRAGDPLARIDHEAYRLRRDRAAAELAAAKAEAELAARELARKRDLVSDKTIPQATFDQAQASYELATARVEAAKAALALAERDSTLSMVTAPADGVVTARHAVSGQWVDVGVGVVDLALGRKVKVAAEVPAHWVPRLSGLDGFTFWTRGDTEQRSADLYSVDPIVSVSSRSFEVVGTAPASSHVRPGMFATARLESPEAVTSLWLPATAVQRSDMPKVFEAVDGRISEIGVQTGRRDDGSIEIVSGLAADQEVIRDVSGLARGLPVTVME
jgi:RND family efflux transporter MFP subunit